MFGRLIGKKKSEAAKDSTSEQEMLIFLAGSGLPDEVYEQCDTSTLDDLLSEALQRQGYVDGTETRETETVVFVYGKDAEHLYSLAEPVLHSYPLCENARIELYRDRNGSLIRTIQN